MKALDLKYMGMLLMTSLLTQANPKDKIPLAAYNKWGDLKDEKIASDGKWISYKMDYAVTTDTLYLQNVATGDSQKFPNGNQAEFTPDSHWFLYADENYLTVLNLKNKKKSNIQSAKKYVFDKTSGTLAVLRANDSRLILYQSNEEIPEEIPNVKDFTFNSTGALALWTNTGIELMQHLKSTTQTILKDNESKFTRLSWDASGKILVFFRTTPNAKTTAGCYHLNTGKMQFLEEEALVQQKVELQFSKPISIAPLADRVFLYTKATEKPEADKDALVEVWEGATPLPYPAQKEVDYIPYAPKLQIWDLRDNCLKTITPDSLPKIKLLPNRKYALACNPNKVGQMQLIDPLADYCLINLYNGNLELFLKAQSMAIGWIMPSPQGSHIGYFNESGWNIYNYSTKANTLLFDKASVNKEEEDEKHKTMSPGWTDDGKYIILYIGLDIWLISPDGKEKKRITNGKETGIKFRPITEMGYLKRPILNEEIGTKSFKLSQGIIIQGILPDKTTSIYKWTPSDALVLLYKSQAKALVRSQSVNGNRILLEEQSAQKPPSLWLLDCKTKKATLQYQSNIHYQKYELAKTKLLSYKNEKGKELNAVLHYPIGYDQNKKYPMLVYVYEQLSQSLYNYNNPSVYNPTGFALANFTNDGYFVLLPDIAYTIGDPGTSILDCVLKAVNTALLTANIDNKRMGLIGHSYGGHETSLLITKTSIFSAAVAGAAATNMISDYLSLNEITQVNKFWKYESHQYRMGFPPFGNWEAYGKNSPVMNAEKIETPLLSWTGKSDGSVDWRQSVELHLALKRLKKTNTLLVYPNEGHILNSLEAQSDLTSRIKKWFDNYLMKE